MKKKPRTKEDQDKEAIHSLGKRKMLVALTFKQLHDQVTAKGDRNMDSKHNNLHCCMRHVPD